MIISKLPSVVTTIIFVLAFQSSVYAQGNMVNLYNWTGETEYGPSPNYGITLVSSTSAIFFGAYSTNTTSGPDHIVPVLAGDLDTTPGATYEISYTVANDPAHEEFGGGTMSFGSFSNSIDLLAMGSPGSSENFDFLVAASSAVTPMSFSWSIDNGYQTTLSSLSVTEVPEASTVGLFGLGGIVWLLAQGWRRLPQIRRRTRTIRC